MSNDTEAARQQAGQDHWRNPQTPMATEQQIQNPDARDAYNGELARQRQQQQSGN